MCQKLNDLLRRPPSWSLFAFRVMCSPVCASDGLGMEQKQTCKREKHVNYFKILLSCPNAAIT